MWLNWQSSWFVISRLSVRVRSSALYWEINTISYNWICDILDGFPSGQRGQTVNLLQIASVVRIHLHPLDSGNKRIETIWNDSKKVWIHLHPLSLKGDVNTIAGWSSLEARRAHNPKVAGSNPAPAIFLCNEKCGLQNIGVKNMLAYSLTDRFWRTYGECRKRKNEVFELSTSD